MVRNDAPDRVIGRRRLAGSAQSRLDRRAVDQTFETVPVKGAGAGKGIQSRVPGDRQVAGFGVKGAVNQRAPVITPTPTPVPTVT